MKEPPNALAAIKHELKQVTALAARSPLDPDDHETRHADISKARVALGELAVALEARVV